MSGSTMLSQWLNNGTTLYNKDTTLASLVFTQGVQTSGVPTALTITGAAHTGITASTLCPGVIFDTGSATKTWATGNITGVTGQYEYAFMAPTYAFASASSISLASTVYIEGPPNAGANCTLTGTLALFVDSGASRFDGGASFNGGTNFNVLAYMNGGQVWKYTAPGAYPYTVLYTDTAVVVDTTVARTINLPALAGIPNGWVTHIKDLTGTAAANNITIDASGSETIEGALTYVISTNFGSVTIYKHSTQWLVI
jgi:hypothetical protein